MKIKSLYLVLKTDQPVFEDGTQLRGYIGNTFREFPILHHHAAESLIYTYPKVQYKVIGGSPTILGIDEGAAVVKQISDQITELRLGPHRYAVNQRVMYEQEMEVRPVQHPMQYRFLTPWIGLNQDNYERFNTLDDWVEKKAMLNRIIIGNILSMAKGLGIVVESRLFVHSRLDPVITQYKGVAMTGFTGEFRVNLTIPDYFGIGKGVSQGAGVVLAVSNTTRPQDAS